MVTCSCYLVCPPVNWSVTVAVIVTDTAKIVTVTITPTASVTVASTVAATCLLACPCISHIHCHSQDCHSHNDTNCQCHCYKPRHCRFDSQHLCTALVMLLPHSSQNIRETARSDSHGHGQGHCQCEPVSTESAGCEKITRVMPLDKRLVESCPCACCHLICVKKLKVTVTVTEIDHFCLLWLIVL